MVIWCATVCQLPAKEIKPMKCNASAFFYLNEYGESIVSPRIHPQIPRWKIRDFCFEYKKGVHKFIPVRMFLFPNLRYFDTSVE